MDENSFAGLDRYVHSKLYNPLTYFKVQNVENCRYSYPFLFRENVCNSETKNKFKYLFK